MAGKVLSGVIGPQLVTYTMDLWQPYIFAGTFLAQAGVAALSALVLLGVRLPVPSATEAAGGRPLKVIVQQFRFVIAVVCGIVSYLLMNFLRTKVQSFSDFVVFGMMAVGSFSSGGLLTSYGWNVDVSLVPDGCQKK